MSTKQQFILNALRENGVIIVCINTAVKGVQLPTYLMDKSEGSSVKLKLINGVTPVFKEHNGLSAILSFNGVKTLVFLPIQSIYALFEVEEGEMPIARQVWFSTTPREFREKLFDSIPVNHRKVLHSPILQSAWRTVLKGYKAYKASLQ